MPTIVTHPAVPLALGLGLGTQVVSPRLLAASAVASILPTPMSPRSGSALRPCGAFRDRARRLRRASSSR
jgi:membrane-bound metal-dependent hydrolase YbcI (DUF457 family)